MKHRRFIFLAALVGSLMAGAIFWKMSQGYADGLQPSVADVAYGTASPTQRLDLFLPQGDGPFPLVVNIHGGGFRVGNKEMLDAPIANALLARGIAVASLNYRLSGEAKFPAALDDALLAVRFLRANATEYKIDPRRVLSFGQSAGGNLASMLGLTLKGDEALAGVVDWFGPADFTSLDADAEAQGCPADHGVAGSPESDYLGRPVADAPELANTASPLHRIHAAAPPFLLQKGDQDCLIPVAQSRKFHEALRAAGVSAELEILTGAGHGDMGLSTPIFASPENVERVVTFMAERLKQP